MLGKNIELTTISTTLSPIPQPFKILASLCEQLPCEKQTTYTDELKRGIFIPTCHYIKYLTKTLDTDDNSMSFFHQAHSAEQIKQQLSANHFPLVLYLMPPHIRKNYFIQHFKSHPISTELLINILGWLPLEQRVTFINELGHKLSPIVKLLDENITLAEKDTLIMTHLKNPDNLNNYLVLATCNPSKIAFDIFVENHESPIKNIYFFEIVEQLFTSNADSVFNEDTIRHIFEYYNQYYSNQTEDYSEYSSSIADMMDAIPENRWTFVYSHSQVNIFFQNILSKKVIMSLERDPFEKIISLTFGEYGSPRNIRKPYYDILSQIPCIKNMLENQWAELRKQLDSGAKHLPPSLSSVILCLPSDQLDTRLTDKMLEKIIPAFYQIRFGIVSVRLFYGIFPLEKRIDWFQKMIRNGAELTINTIVLSLEYLRQKDKWIFLEMCATTIIKNAMSNDMKKLFLAVDEHFTEQQQLRFYLYIYGEAGITAFITVDQSNKKIAKMILKYAQCIVFLMNHSNDLTDLTHIYSPYFYLLYDSTSFYSSKLKPEEYSCIRSRLTAVHFAASTSSLKIDADAAATEFIELITELEKEIKQPENPRNNTNTWSFSSPFSSASTREDILIAKLSQLRKLYDILLPNTQLKRSPLKNIRF